jgi:hypothetical protein
VRNIEAFQAKDALTAPRQVIAGGAAHRPDANHDRIESFLAHGPSPIALSFIEVSPLHRPNHEQGCSPSQSVHHERELVSK